MFLKGFDKFKEKTPGLRGFRILILPIYICLIIIIVSYILNVFYSFPGQNIGKYSNNFLILIPFFGVALIEIIAFLLLSQMWIWRDRLKIKYGSLAYQRIIFVGLAGITTVIYLSFNTFTQFQNYSLLFWKNGTNSIFVTPVYSVFNDSNLGNIFHIGQTFLGYLFLIMGILMSFRSIYTFGIDYTTVVYLYFPEEGEIKENEIYSVVRHPMYGGLIFVAFGGFLFNLTLFSLIFFAIYFLGFYIHIHFIEESELITRFGESYKAYRKSVPPFFINPFKFPILLKFIIRG